MVGDSCRREEEKVNFQKRLFKRIQKSPPLFFLLAYLTVILIGTLLLCLPFSSAEGSFTSPVDAFFVSTSAVCVTGLTPVTTASFWSPLGQAIILLLIQLGGLGVMTAVGALALLTGRKLGMSQRVIFMEEKNEDELTGLVRFLKFILKATFLIEGIGALILASQMVPQFGPVKGLLYAIFLSISAFCNAGFDPLGPVSLSDYSANPVVLLTIAALIIVAGLGYVVYIDFFFRKTKRIRLQTKMVTAMTLLLLTLGTLGIFLMEYGNPSTIGGMGLGEKTLNAFFQSASLRTAGFFSFDQAAMTRPSSLFSCFLMFIGGSPGGTAGGLKTTTMAVLVLGLIARVRHTRDLPIFHRNCTQENFQQALILFTASIFWISIVGFIIQLVESDKEFLDLFFEVISAYGTVGLSRGITGNLHALSKILVAITMVFGKIGPVTMLGALLRPAKYRGHRVAEESVMIG